ncbi:MAG: hypothetical protein IT368_09155, partial [Candidatus Hydrogenedentes bacterium]|nr:hypothetical protein [Candidatus Hydrogenedentota bacterium]
QYDHVPEDQLPAVLFAQHWAEHRGLPDAEALQAFQKHYGERTQDTILLALQFINTMNYTVKGAEAFLARLKFWKRPAGISQLP